MSGKINPVTGITRDAIQIGKPLTVSKIRELRAESQRAVTIFKSVFWVGIVIFNLLLWAPLPIVVANKTILYVIAFSVLAISLVVPIIGLRKHQMSLELLKVNKESLKRKTVNETGRAYMDKVNLLDRPFINAEFELLQGSKHSTPADHDR